MDFATITLAGHVTADPVLRKGKDDKEYSTFSIAVNQRLGPQENASYYDCVAPGFIAQNMQKAGVSKGTALAVTGSVTIRPYKDRSGNNGTSVNVKVLDWHFAGTRPKSDGQPADTAGAEQPARSAGGQSSGSVRPPVDLQDEDDLPL
jgi:single-stranded DNA-binding protein